MNNLSKMLTVVAVLCLFTACTKKTQEAVQYNPPSQERGQGDDSRQNRRGGPPEFAQLLTEMDANGDGLLSQSEVKGRIAKDFATIDADGNGFITEEEMKNAPKPKRKGGGKRNN